jgi:hypothetical protein
MKISATVNKGKPEARTCEIEVNIPGDLDGLVALYGKDVAYNAAIDSLVITVQAGMRRAMEDKVSKDGKVTPGKTQAEIQALYGPNWRPDVRTVVRQSAFEKAQTSIKQLSAEERAALLAELTGKPSAPAAAAAVKK